MSRNFVEKVDNVVTILLVILIGVLAVSTLALVACFGYHVLVGIS